MAVIEPAKVIKKNDIEGVLQGLQHKKIKNCHNIVLFLKIIVFAEFWK